MIKLYQIYDERRQLLIKIEAHTEESAIHEAQKTHPKASYAKETVPDWDPIYVSPEELQ